MADNSKHFQPFTNEKLFPFADNTISPTLPFLKLSNMSGEGLKGEILGEEREDLMQLAIKKKKKKIGALADLEER